jgi:ribonuclease VapC
VSSYVLDTSALLALINAEPGSERVAHAVMDSTCVLLSVNLTETLTRMADWGISVSEATARLQTLGLSVLPFDESLAVAAAGLRTTTKARGLSLGDRACLALAQQRGDTALTADRAWAGLDIGIAIEMIRP